MKPRDSVRCRENYVVIRNVTDFDERYGAPRAYLYLLKHEQHTQRNSIFQDQSI